MLKWKQSKATTKKVARQMKSELEKTKLAFMDMPDLHVVNTSFIKKGRILPRRVRLVR